jgi:dTDP-glucose pyrophosphorylase
MNVLIPMAGLGSRFPVSEYKVPKPMIPIKNFGLPMIEVAIKTLDVSGKYIFIVNSAQPEYFEVVKTLWKAANNPIIINVDYLTEGPASTCLLATQFINNDEPLVIANCDQIMEWSGQSFLEYCNQSDSDGIVVTYDVQTTKNSYVKLDERGWATEFAEKKIISNHSLNGIHYWKKGSDFVESAMKMIDKDIRVNNEFYISQTYNELVQEGKKITIYEIDKFQHWAVGTPEDLDKYNEHANL